MASDASLEQAIQDLDQQVSLRGFGPADLGVVFVSTSFASELSRVLPLLQRRFQATHWLGCCGGGVIGVDRHGQSCELEQQPAVGLSLIRLPGAMLQSFHIDLRNLPDLDGPREPWRQLVDTSHGDAINGLLLLVDPGSSGIKDLLGGLDYAFAGVPKVGGTAGAPWRRRRFPAVSGQAMHRRHWAGHRWGLDCTGCGGPGMPAHWTRL